MTTAWMIVLATGLSPAPWPVTCEHVVSPVVVVACASSCCECRTPMHQNTVLAHALHDVPYGAEPCNVSDPNTSDTPLPCIRQHACSRWRVIVSAVHSPVSTQCMVALLYILCKFLPCTYTLYGGTAADDDDEAGGPSPSKAPAAAGGEPEDVRGPHTNLAVRLSKRDPNKKWLLGERLSYVLLTGTHLMPLCFCCMHCCSCLIELHM
jgi:hypothetical protein